MPNTGVKVTAQQFNTEVVDTFNELWADNYQTSDINDVNRDLHSFGWGQVEVPSVLKEDIVEAEDTNLIFSKINAGLMHQYDDISVTLLHKTPGIPVTLDYTQQNGYTTETDNTKDIITRLAHEKSLTQRFEVHPNYTRLEIENIPFSNMGRQWTEENELVLKLNWSSYNDARYFFNAGGRISVVPESLSGTSRPWHNMFKGIVNVDISAYVCHTQGWNTGYFNGGFYNYGTDLQDSDSEGFRKVFYVLGGAGSGSEYGEYGEYGEYRASEYGFLSGAGWAAEYDEEISEYGGNSAYGSYSAYGGEYNYREFSIWLRAEQTETEFNLYLKVKLNDDEGIQNTVFDEVLQVYLESIIPIDAPINTTNPQNFTVNNTTYNFSERLSPISVSLAKDWT